MSQHKEYEDRQKHLEFVHWSFDPGGRIQNSWSSSLQDKEKSMQDRPMVFGPSPSISTILWAQPIHFYSI